VAPGGGYEFRRCAVIGGQAEAATVRPIPVAMPAPTGKTAVTLRTCVAGNEFTVSLDGQVIETWTDSRLTTGGIGFVGAPEDRARLYWVKVTPTGNLSKEYSKR
jgi:allophanate hydrolase subunit 2